MTTESDKRAAALAVFRYGADRARVKTVYHAARLAHANGEDADLLGLLVAEQLLSRAQADELRQDLERTRLDCNGPVNGSHSPTGVGNGRNSGFHPRSIGGYRILRQLGEGGMGSVYLGYHELQERHVAIKVLADSLTTNQGYLSRFHREARSGSLLEHGNIVRFIASGRDAASGRHYLVLEYVDGPSARSLLEKFGRLTVGDAVHVILDIARALEHIHSLNFVHRDIKPDNILIASSGLAKLADLGLAKRMDDSTHLTATRQSVGTPYYMPYEQVMSAKQVDGRSDIYALGATFYHLVTGEVPFPGSTPLEVTERKAEGAYAAASSVQPDIPEALDRVLDKMLALNPADRYQTVSEAIVELDRSGLAAAVPSFIDPDAALRDPVVRARLQAPVQTTHPDMRAPSSLAAAKRVPGQWYLRYRNREGAWCKAKISTQQLAQRLGEGRVPDGAEVSRDSNEGFRVPTDFPEFRRALAQRQETPAKGATEEPTQPATPPVRRSRWAWGRRRVLVSAGLCVGAVTALVSAYLAWLR